MKFFVHGTVTIGVTTVVEADSEKEALAKAAESEVAQLCYQCSQLVDGEWVAGDGLDGSVEILRAEQYSDPS